MGFPAQLYLAWCRRFQRCTATCTEAVVEGVGSKTTDLKCRCSDLGSVAANMTPCIALTGDCDFEDDLDDTDLTASLPQTRLGSVKGVVH
ncbi:uncharacterized protein QYS62_011517 [Fusarium acuminatum]|uniref:Extracellular membrane protein CFEM domain-containing protein n=1 Tax=Fusarium acuminatum TaxID=5515 RepID=A0ABZ2XEI4_9HYPO